MGGRAKRAEIYPEELCKQIVYGLIEQMKEEGRLIEGVKLPVGPTEKKIAAKPEIWLWGTEVNSLDQDKAGSFVLRDVSGQLLNREGPQRMLVITQMNMMK